MRSPWKCGEWKSELKMGPWGQEEEGGGPGTGLKKGDCARQSLTVTEDEERTVSDAVSGL